MSGRRVLTSAVLLATAAGLVMVGRLSVDSEEIRADAYGAGHRDGDYAGYFTGLQDGLTQGRREGRVLQEVSAAPATSRRPVHDAFESGYEAGADDVFAGYDGGWQLSEPYMVTLERGRTPIAYRISSRKQFQSGINYFLCAEGGGMCQEGR